MTKATQPSVLADKAAQKAEMDATRKLHLGKGDPDKAYAAMKGAQVWNTRAVPEMQPNRRGRNR